MYHLSNVSHFQSPGNIYWYFQLNTWGVFVKEGSMSHKASRPWIILYIFFSLLVQFTPSSADKTWCTDERCHKSVSWETNSDIIKAFQFTWRMIYWWQVHCARSPFRHGEREKERRKMRDLFDFNAQAVYCIWSLLCLNSWIKETNLRLNLLPNVFVAFQVGWWYLCSLFCFLSEVNLYYSTQEPNIKVKSKHKTKYCFWVPTVRKCEL